MAEEIWQDAWALVGNTPTVRLSRIGDPRGAEVCAKLEAHNPSGSVKDRPARAMLQAAEARGELRPGAHIVEATSGNTGISLAMLAACRGYRCTVVMPQDMSPARQSILRAYGADVALTGTELGMRGAVEEAHRLVATTGAFMPRQFENPDNVRAHEQTTGAEMWRTVAALDGRLDAVVIGVGTGGTLTGVARALKPKLPALRVVAVEPAGSPVLSGGRPGLHAIQGLGAGFKPSILDMGLVDDVLTVTDLEAERMVTRLAREEGLFVGPSSGANAHAALRVARVLGAGARVMTILCDTGERYT